MAMQISSVVIQKELKLQLLEHMLPSHTGVDTSHHMHKLKLRSLEDWTSTGRPSG